MRRRRGPAEIHRFPVAQRMALGSVVSAACPLELSEAVARVARAKGVEPGDVIRCAVAHALLQEGETARRIFLLSESVALSRPWVRVKRGRR